MKVKGIKINFILINSNFFRRAILIKSTDSSINWINLT